MSTAPSTDTATLAPSDSVSTTKTGTSSKKYTGKKKTQSKKTERVPPPTTALPPPGNLSTKASPLKDVFCIDEFETQGLSLRPTNVHPEFQAEHAGFMDLLETTYDVFCYTDKHFRQNVPRSLYNYYNVQLLYARINELNKLHQRNYDIRFDNMMFSLPFTAHDIIIRYLAGLGDFKSPDGELFRLGDLTVLNAQGHHGHYSPATSVAYEQAPAPEITLLAIQADLTVPHIPNWTLPAAIQPVARPGHTAVPNENLLGYRTSVQLINKEIRNLNQLGFTQNTLPTDIIGRFRTSMVTMAYVSSIIESHKTVKTQLTAPGSAIGSISQLPYVRLVNPDAVVRGMKYTRNEMSVHSRHQLGVVPTASALYAVYRMQRDARQDGTLPYLGFTWETNAMPNVEVPPPNGYAQLMNNRFNLQDSARINTNYFDSNTMDRIILLRDKIKVFTKASGTS